MSPLAGIALALALAALAAGAGWLAWRRLRRRPRALRRVPHLRHPVVLVHGLLGFDAVQLRGARHDYFRGLPAMLGALGCEVHAPQVAPTGSVEARAEALAACVRALGARKVNLVAHSMGGLDARFAVSRLGLADRVASLTTIGTPHRGTPLADVGTALIGERLGLRRALSRLGADLSAFYALTTERTAALNDALPDAPGVAYGSVVGAAPGRRQAQAVLVPTWLWLRQAAGANDGLVPASSQPWGEVLARIDADHFAQIGWSRSFDAPAFYERLLGELRGRGF